MNMNNESKISDMSGKLKTPYFVIYGKQIKSDFKTFKNSKVREYEAEDLEALPIAKEV